MGTIKKRGNGFIGVMIAIGIMLFVGVIPIQAEPVYVLLTDSDFEVGFTGSLEYIGTHEYVEVPSIIRGNQVDYPRGMFRGTNVKGVRFTNQYINNMSSAFESSKATTLKVTNNPANKVLYSTHYMFQDSQAKVIDLSELDGSRLTDTTSMFYNSKATTGWARTQEDADKFNSSTNKPPELIFKVAGPPVIGIQPYDIDYTNKSITITAEVDRGTINKTQHTFDSNGSFTFIAENNKGTVEKTVTITNIDKSKPNINIRVK